MSVLVLLGSSHHSCAAGRGCVSLGGVGGCVSAAGPPLAAITDDTVGLTSGSSTCAIQPASPSVGKMSSKA